LFIVFALFSGDLSWYFTCKYIILQTPSITLPYPFSPTLYCSTAFSVFHCFLFLHKCDGFLYYLVSIIPFFISLFLVL
jgi:hypothetical protein